MLKNLRLYRMPAGISVTIEDLEQYLAAGAFRPCSELELARGGWVPPSPSEGLVFAQNHQRVLCYQREEKIIPPSYVRLIVAERAAELEETQGYRPGRKQMRELKDKVVDELLPKAFVRRSRTTVWIDNLNGWLAIDATSEVRCDEIIERLRQSLPMIPQIALPQTAQAPTKAMTAWLAGSELSSAFSIDDACELRDVGEGRGAIRYKGLPVETDDIKRLIGSGKMTTRLAMTWRDKISFTFCDGLILRGLTVLDLLRETQEEVESEADRFAANVTLMTGELALLIADLVAECGGEALDVEGAAQPDGGSDGTSASQEAAVPGVSETTLPSSVVVLGAAGKDAGTRHDPLYERAKAIVVGQKRASVSAVQRGLGINYAHAARLIEAMEGDVVGPVGAGGVRPLLSVPGNVRTAA